MLFNKIIKKYQSFSIITKLLIPQIITLIFGIFYILFTYQSISSISNSYTSIKQDIIPSIEKSTKNIMLLKQISSDFTFATLSLEDEFLESSKQYNQTILNNLSIIQDLTHINVAPYKKIYTKYFNYTYNIVKNMTSIQSIESNQDDINKISDFYNETTVKFKELNLKVKDIVSKKTNAVYTQIESFHTNVLLFGVLLYAILSFVTFLIYKRLQTNFTNLIKDISSIRQSGLIKEKLAQFSKNEFGIIASELNAIFEDFNQAYQNVVDIANKDKLTQLYNRVYMDKKIDELVELDEPFAVVIADIDHFKKINDTYGHIVGDKVLESFASILQEHLKDKAIVSRWGGEEFLIVIPNCSDIDEIYHIIEYIRDQIERYDFPEVHNVTASFGCTIHYPSNSFKDTIHQADKALYKAKELGRNCVVKF